MIEVSFVISCLNEAGTIGTWIGKALRALAAGALRAEVLVSANAASDHSAWITEHAGAPVIRSRCWPDYPERPKSIAAQLTYAVALFFRQNKCTDSGARWVMGPIPFICKAALWGPGTAKRARRTAVFRATSLSFHLYFRRRLECLRCWEQSLARVPLGGQYPLVAHRDAL